MPEALDILCQQSSKTILGDVIASRVAQNSGNQTDHGTCP